MQKYYENLVPGVIDRRLLEILIKNQQPKGELGEIIKKEFIDFDKIKKIKIEFLDIIRIDYLWILRNLEELSLNNNKIEKIENLNELKHLKKLDLSFNCIKKIESLDELIKLENLSLYSNKIDVLENMHQLKQLTVLNIGNNLINDLENVLYLRKLLKLRSLNLEKNPCTRKIDLRIFVAFMIPQIQYFDYKLITDEEKRFGEEEFKKKFRSILEEILNEENEYKLQESRLKLEEIHKKYFVENLTDSSLFDIMFQNDPDGIAFLELGQEVQNIFTQYKEEFLSVTRKLIEIGLEQGSIRDKEIEVLQSSLKNIIDKNRTPARKLINELREESEKTINELKELQQNYDNETIDVNVYNVKTQQSSDKFDRNLHDYWKNLMKLEFELHEKIENLNITFSRNLVDLITVLNEKIRELFLQLRDLETNYKETMLNYLQEFMKSGFPDDANPSEKIREIINDNESIKNAVTASHEQHMLAIDQREEIFTKRSKTWVTTFADNLEKNEIGRNRSQIFEIYHFLTSEKDNFFDTFLQSTQFDFDLD